jgi:hypothetical protein
MRTSHDSWHKEDDLEHATEAVKDFTKAPIHAKSQMAMITTPSRNETPTFRHISFLNYRSTSLPQVSVDKITCSLPAWDTF